MSTIAPERAEEIITRWLDGTDLDVRESPAGPLFAGGDRAEHEITATGGMLTFCCGCTGSFDPRLGWIECCA